jgi:hypothetical protein
LSGSSLESVRVRNLIVELYTLAGMSFAVPRHLECREVNPNGGATTVWQRYSPALFAVPLSDFCADHYTKVTA